MKPHSALIVHGTFGHPEENWIPWLRDRLIDAGIAVSVPPFPTPEGQSLKAWRDTLDREVETIGAGWLLFGHSLGATFVLDILERVDAAVEAAYLVSGFTGPVGSEEFDTVNATFVERDFEWQRIRRGAKRFYVYQGDDDPYVDQKYGEQLAHELRTARRVVPGGGHLNAAAGFESFELLWLDVKETLAAP